MHAMFKTRLLNKIIKNNIRRTCVVSLLTVYANPPAPSSFGGIEALRRYAHKPRKRLVEYLSTVVAGFPNPRLDTPVSLLVWFVCVLRCLCARMLAWPPACVRACISADRRAAV